MPDIQYDEIVNLPDDTVIETLSDMVKQNLLLDEEIKNIEELLDEKKKQRKKLNEDDIPAKMASIGVRELMLNDGSTISLEQYYSASIAEHKEFCLNWLVEQGFSSLIKDLVAIPFNKGDFDEAQRLIEILEKSGYRDYKRDLTVHPQTLKAFVREQLEKGSYIPAEFKIYVGTVTKIKRKI